MHQDTRQAFLTSVEKTYGRQLRRFLGARLRNAVDTPDLMQEIFLRLLRIEDYETIRNPQAYLYTIARHVLQQHALKQASMPLDLQPAEATLDWMPSEGGPEAEVESEQAFTELERTLKAQSPRAYATLVLSRCHGMSLQEIGTQLGVSRAQVKKYLAKALLHARESLMDANGEAR